MAKKVSKLRVVKDFDKIPKEIQAAIKADYPNGFSHKLIAYTTPKGEKVMALPYETDDINYLVRVTVLDTRTIMRDDDDDLADDKPIRDDLDLDGLDIEGLKEEDEASVADDDDDDDDFVPTRRRRKGDDDDDDDDDY
jgi:DNA-directed RNA polymerase subunit delta